MFRSLFTTLGDPKIMLLLLLATAYLGEYMKVDT